jgi:hypothetical protein
MMTTTKTTRKRTPAPAHLRLRWGVASALSLLKIGRTQEAAVKLEVALASDIDECGPATPSPEDSAGER